MAAKTLDEVIDDLLNNADFEELESLSKAQKFITAATRYFILAPSSASEAGSSMAINPPQVENLLQRARQVVAEQATSRGSVRFLATAEGFRR